MGRTKQTDEERHASIERRRARQRRYYHEKHPESRSYKDNVERPNDHALLNYINERLKDDNQKSILEIAREYYGYTNNDK